MVVVNFFKELFSMKWYWVIWIVILVLTNVVGGIYFVDTVEGSVVLFCMIFAFLFMVYLYSKKGFVKLLGLAHFPWLFLVPFLLYRQLLGIEDMTLQYWVMGVVTTNSISLAFDIWDVWQYYKAK